MNSVFNVSLRLAIIGALGISVASLTGCATTKAAAQMNDNVANMANRDFQQARTPTTPSGNFEVDKGFFAAKKPIDVTPVNPKVPLPSVFYRPAQVSIQNRVSLSELVSNISNGIGMRVLVAPDVYTSGTSSAAVASRGPVVGSSSNPTAAPPSALPPLPGGSATPSAANEASPIPEGDGDGTTQGLVFNGFQYDGNLAGLLDSVTARLNLSWRYDGQEVQIYRYETRMFRLSALAGDSTINATLSTKATSGSSGSGGGSGGGGSGGSTGANGGGGLSGNSGQNTTVNSKLEIWKDVEDAIKATLSKGSTYSMVPSAGLITVRATPTELREVAAQMREFNRIYSRSVVLKVDVYAVDNTHGDNYGLDWSVFWKKANGFGLSLVSSGNTSTANGPIGPTFTLKKTGGALSGSNAMFAALSSMGNTSLVTSATAITLNGQTVPLNVSREQAYLQSYSTTLNGGTSGTSTTTLTPGVVQEGFSMNFTPRILDGNNIMMRYAVDLSNIDQITTFTSPDGLSAIQLPSRSVRNFLQNVDIHSGQSLMLTGFQQVQAKDTSSGPLNAKAWFAGGQRNASTLNRTIVIVVTPYITQQ